MLILGVLLLASAAAGTTPNPLAPADDGRLECYQPDERRKTCVLIGSYRALGGGAYSSTATALASREANITVETSGPVEVKKGAVCGTMTADDIRTGTVRIAGRLANDAESASILDGLVDSLGLILDKEVCTAYVTDGRGLTTRITVDGRREAAADARVKWIRPDEGYTVAP